ncbi:MAG: endonuclease MutS2 [Candidatus Marinimicrobia bacterium]|nr:endonuclease MutS2 [Candidatus Neomarinimicrobiota bacterium]MCF7850562.1 endonuclease MutS2 [Candidatus Neomarinimicrobiota bacterium]MCF7903704.1 endonuclease MutS2 [Candidatus Neomarinimicrobiota bacterium]
MSDNDPTQYTDINLGFDDVRQWLADEAAGPFVKDQFEQLQLDHSLDGIGNQFRRIHEFESIMESNNGFLVHPYEDLKETLRLLALPGSTLFPENLTDLRNILEQTRLLQAIYLKSVPAEDFIWEGDLRRIEPLPNLEKDIQRIIGDDGEVLDSASSTLSSLRQKLRRSAGTVRSRMNDLVRKYGDEGFLNESQAGLRAGRLVLPVVSSYKHQVKGVIQDMSNTGTTTFIEPYEVIELNNQIKAMEVEEQQEVQRILRQLTASIHEHHETINRNYEVLQLIDFHIALAKFSKTFACSIPKVSETGEFKLIAARNPRLALQRKVVPLDLHMDASIRTLVITGPNAGGKTVALKTIGLLAMMANAGIPIPAAEGSIIPFLDTIYSDIGDQQSLVNDLSTFSAHMSTIINILESASPDSLILLDELGTGTDPAEGGALARAVLESLAEIGAKTVATTHLGDLKVFAHEAEGVMNGAMEFDRNGLKPTYKFLAGVPGSSYGFEISKRLGLKQKLLDTAKAYLGVARHSMEKLLQTLESERVSLSSLRDDNMHLQRELKVKQKKMDSALETVQKAERKADREAARKAGQIIADARQTVEHVIRQIKETQAEKTNIREVHGQLNQLEEQIDHVLEETEEAPRIQKIKEDAIQKGVAVTVLSLDQQGVVLEEPVRGKVMVEVEGKRLHIPISWLGQAVQQSKEVEARAPVVKVSNRSESTFKLDLRGFRAEEAISEVSRFVDQAVLSGIPMLQIIHGKGTGVIRKVVHEVLDKHSAVKKKRLGGLDEGGAGVTFVEMK